MFQIHVMYCNTITKIWKTACENEAFGLAETELDVLENVDIGAKMERNVCD